MARYNTDGSLDTSFNGDGKVVLDFGGSNDFVHDVKVQSDGAIVVTGSVGNALAVARFNPDGTAALLLRERLTTGTEINS